MSKNGSFMFLSVGITVVCGIGWWAVLLRGDGGEMWVTSLGPGWIGRNRIGSWRGNGSAS